jgi:hypothetical protein
MGIDILNITCFNVYIGVDIMAQIAVNTPMEIELKSSFEISADPFFSEANQKRLEEAVTRLNAGKGTTHDINPYLTDYDAENRPNDYDWGKSMGREIWD